MGRLSCPILGFVVLSLSAGQSAPQQPPAAGGVDRGMISGRVVDEAERPVTAAEVRYDLPGVAHRIVHTDDQGRFLLDRVRPTRFGAQTNPAELTVRHPAYVETRVRLDDARPVPANGPIRIRVRLERGARVVGTLADADTGRPLAGLRVRALGDDYPGQEWFAASDAEGRYELRVPAGRVRVQPQVPADARANYYSVEDERSPFLFTAGAEPVEANFTFRRAHSVRGTVKVIGAAAPVAGLCVEAQELEKPVGRAWPLVRRGDVRADGTFRIDQLRPGRYGLRVFEPRLGLWQRTDDPIARVEVPAGRDVSGVALDVPPAWSPANLPELRGQVVDEQGRAVPNAEVELRPADAEGTIYTTSADAGGAFRIRGFAPGETWHLWAWDGSGRRVAVVQLPNPEQWAGPFPLALGPGATLSGTVRDANGRPVVGAGVAVCEIVKDRWGTGEVRRPIREARTDDAGRYMIEGFVAPPGPSRAALAVGSLPPDAEPVGVRGARARPFSSASYRDFPIEPGRETSGLDFLSRQAGSRTVFDVPRR